MKSKLFVLVCILLLSGCNLANANKTCNPDKDVLVGIMIATEENAFEDGLHKANCKLSYDLRTCYFEQTYELPIYSLVGFYTKDIHGNIATNSSVIQGSRNIFSMIHNRSSKKELYSEYKVFYTKPINIVISKIYQNEEGLQYVIVDREKDTNSLTESEWELGVIYDKTTQNFLQQDSIYSNINISFSKMDTPIETQIHLMSKDNKVIESNSYSPNEVVRSLELSDEIEYVIFETILENNGEQSSNRSIYSKKDSKIYFHENPYPLDDGFIGLQTTIIEWK